jgi:hypothetical protein
MSRGNGKISRDSSFSTYSNEDPSWAKDYYEAVEKYSVKSKREDASIFDEINQILGNAKSKYSSVEEAVLDMQKRTGLYEVLQKQAAEETPEMFKKFPDLKDFIKDKIDIFPGSAVSAIADLVLQEPKYKDAIPPGEHLPSDVEEYINKLKGEMTPREEHKSDGKVDLDIDNNTVKDNNPLNSLNPIAF